MPQFIREHLSFDGHTARWLLARTWNDIESAATGSDLLVRLQVNRINRFAERMTALCEDPSLLPDE